MSHYPNLDFVLSNSSSLSAVVALHHTYTLSEIQGAVKANAQAHIDDTQDKVSELSTYIAKMQLLRQRVFDRNTRLINKIISQLEDQHSPILTQYQSTLARISSKQSSGSSTTGLKELREMTIGVANLKHTDITQINLTISNIESEVLKIDKMIRLKNVELSDLVEQLHNQEVYMRHINAAIELQSRLQELGYTVDQVKNDDLARIAALVKEGTV